ncbi:hypothetical protein QFZ66_007176 [Streptomyces sp. B4I13]|nr:hypothetical protein [Streptomyces sp. B4I13]
MSTTLLRFAAEARTCWEQEEIQTRILEEMCSVIPGKAAGVYLLVGLGQVGWGGACPWGPVWR